MTILNASTPNYPRRTFSFKDLVLYLVLVLRRLGQGSALRRQGLCGTTVGYTGIVLVGEEPRHIHAKVSTRKVSIQRTRTYLHRPYRKEKKQRGSSKAETCDYPSTPDVESAIVLASRLDPDMRHVFQPHGTSHACDHGRTTSATSFPRSLGRLCTNYVRSVLVKFRIFLIMA
ncbi:hypothetical protein BJV77DRAFT_172271 [Russula vinacea]|jgi:hypothetical protein|nr:hypothetical protein BJV77DRAFT_172271 [Russula vinacea]